MLRYQIAVFFFLFNLALVIVDNVLSILHKSTILNLPLVKHSTCRTGHTFKTKHVLRFTVNINSCLKSIH